MELKRVFVLTTAFCLLIPGIASALVVDIHGKILTPKNEGDACIDITGTYDGFIIEADEIGNTPQICFNDTKQDVIDIHNVNIVAIAPTVFVPEGSTEASEDFAPVVSEYISSEKTISIEHTFPPGPNGLITVRKRIFGFFSTPTGIGAASDCSIKFDGFFSQKNNYDKVAEAFEHSVGEEVDSAIFELVVYAKEKYLISGERTLKAELKFTIKEIGQSLTLPVGTSLTLDTGSRFEDKLESLTVTPDLEELIDSEDEDEEGEL